MNKNLNPEELEMIGHQGDIIIFKVNDEDINISTKIETEIVRAAEGEVTGHHHDVQSIDNSVISVINEDVKDKKLYNGAAVEQFLIEVSEGEAAIFHQEHEPFFMGSGTYLIVKQRQYNPFLKKLERVTD